MSDFKEVFETKIPYLSDEIGHAIGGGSDSWSMDEVYDVVEDILRDFLKRYENGKL